MFSRTGHQEHHRRVEALVQRWLAERQALIVAWTALQDAQRGNAAPATLSARLEAFCEILMDYVSAGHFEVYDELLAEAERRDDGPAPASQALLGRVQATTDAVIRFNDLCENPHDAAALAQLPRELPVLGLELESRFQTEDRLIALLHDSAGSAAVTADDRP
ncbi:MAG: regulator of RpoD, Rsd/AlgQ [Moraxellaceae bacterium]|jgi:regulator of sigma D|nr:regulator of RpoD, Rsd/AlgQ [Moraxellaceae bacterium]